MLQNAKCQIVTKLKLQMVNPLKTQILVKFKQFNYDKTQKLKFGLN